jgi:hypothetical protein
MPRLTTQPPIDPTRMLRELNKYAMEVILRVVAATAPIPASHLHALCYCLTDGTSPPGPGANPHRRLTDDERSTRDRTQRLVQAGILSRTPMRRHRSSPIESVVAAGPNWGAAMGLPRYHDILAHVPVPTAPRPGPETLATAMLTLDLIAALVAQPSALRVGMRFLDLNDDRQPITFYKFVWNISPDDLLLPLDRHRLIALVPDAADAPCLVPIAPHLTNVEHPAIREILRRAGPFELLTASTSSANRRQVAEQLAPVLTTERPSTQRDLQCDSPKHAAGRAAETLRIFRRFRTSTDDEALRLLKNLEVLASFRQAHAPSAPSADASRVVSANPR